MKRALKLMAAALAAVAAMSYASATAFADKLRTVDGVTYRYSDTGEQLGTYTGWTQNSVGKRYYINGILIKNKWLKMKSGKRFYVDEDGYMLIGWTHVGQNWYYISSKLGRLSGTQSIDGIEYNFGADGKWDKKAPNSTNEKHSSIYDVYFRITNGKYDDIYGGAGIPDGMLVIWSVNGQAEKMINARYPGIGGIVYKPAKYSVAELEKVRAGINDFIRRDRDNGNEGLWFNGPATWIENNRLGLEISQKQYDRISAYIDSLPNKNCLDIRIGEYVFSDD
ncbi:MAG: hypothetical protein J6X60_00870 [Ruminiclostridium sp.]|nr:hypothetical protein [Ruminiclostridium sp.]